MTTAEASMTTHIEAEALSAAPMAGDENSRTCTKEVRTSITAPVTSPPDAPTVALADR